MPSLKLLKTFGTTDERLKEIFTAKRPSQDQGLPPDQYEAQCKLADQRKCFEDRINNRLMEHMNFSLKNFSFYTSVDLAWEPPPLSPSLMPLILYAQGKIDVAKCANQLDALKCADKFVKRDPKTKVVVDIDLPRFFEVSMNLVRSMITRRLAAQSNKYNNLFPYFKYESRSTSQVGKLRADIFSQRTDIMADQFDYRHHDTQVYRDMLLYSHSVDFVRAAWERDIQWQQKPKPPEDKSDTFEAEQVITREGIGWVNPHPTRIFYDDQFPLSSINSDSGCTYVGFWDVDRYGNIFDNPKYWNRNEVGYTQDYVGIFQTYANYFSQYYTVINVPPAPEVLGATGANDRKNTIGLYSGEQRDTSVVISNYYEKLIPKEWGIGNYPFPIWVRFITAGWSTVLYAEILPSTPGAVASYNMKDDRRLSLGVGHELLAYQDQMSNLQSYLLLALKGDNLKVLVLDIDQLSPAQITDFRAKAQGNSFYSQTHVLEVSRSKLNELGLKVEDVINLVETRSSTQISLIFQAMLQLMTTCERLQAFSPQEQGQPAPREISATETNLIAGTTESVYNFISDAIDEFRAAKKRIIYESYMDRGDEKFRLPIIGRYPKDIVEKAGLKMSPDSDTDDLPEDGLYTGTVIGNKQVLQHDLIFTSRDGAERASNPQAAATLTEGLKVFLPIPAVQEALTKKQFFSILNEWFRLSGAFDLKIELDGTDADQPLSPSAGQEVQQALEQITQALERHDRQLQQIQQLIQTLTGGRMPMGAGPPPPMAAAA